MKMGSVFAILSVGIIIPLLVMGTSVFPSGEQDRDVILAAAQNDLPKLLDLLKRGANVNAQDARGRTALLASVEGNHLAIAEVLMEAGADVNIQDNKSDSPFLLAGAEGRVEIMQRMLQAEPDFTLLNRFGGTALIPACERGHVEMVRILLQTKMDIDHVNHLGWTALLEAIILSDGGPRHQRIVRMLVEAGADVNIADNEGVTPLQHARQKGFQEIVNTLEAAGAS